MMTVTTTVMIAYSSLVCSARGLTLCIVSTLYLSVYKKMYELTKLICLKKNVQMIINELTIGFVVAFNFFYF